MTDQAGLWTAIVVLAATLCVQTWWTRKRIEEIEDYADRLTAGQHVLIRSQSKDRDLLSSLDMRLRGLQASQADLIQSHGGLEKAFRDSLTDKAAWEKEIIRTGTGKVKPEVRAIEEAD